MINRKIIITIALTVILIAVIFYLNKEISANKPQADIINAGKPVVATTIVDEVIIKDNNITEVIVKNDEEIIAEVITAAETVEDIIVEDIIVEDTKITPKDWLTPNIFNAVFTTNIKNRIPQDIITNSDNSLRKIFFFTDIRNLSVQTISHKWFYKDRLMASVPLDIGGKRWRTWSSKNLWHTWLGKWRVQVVDENGNILLEKSFEYYKQ